MAGAFPLTHLPRAPTPARAPPDTTLPTIPCGQEERQRWGTAGSTTQSMSAQVHRGQSHTAVTVGVVTSTRLQVPSRRRRHPADLRQGPARPQGLAHAWRARCWLHCPRGKKHGLDVLCRTRCSSHAWCCHQELPQARIFEAGCPARPAAAIPVRRSGPAGPGQAPNEHGLHGGLEPKV